MLNIVLVASGSGGHIFPAISLAQNLKLANKDCQVIFFTRKGKLENEILASFSFKVISLDIDKFKFSLAIFKTGLEFIKVFLNSISTLHKIKPSVVVGFGGYLSIPVVFAARVLRIPVVLHEQNVQLGKANRMVSFLARKIAFSFKESGDIALYKNLRKKMIFTGNPIRTFFYSLKKEESYSFFGFARNKFTLLVLGGSQGSLSIDVSVKIALSNLPPEDLNELQIIHICGKNDKLSLESYYNSLGLEYKVYNFLKEIAQGYRIANLAITRSGASTIAELCSYGVPAILIPYPYAGKHQYANSEVLVNREAAFLVEENNDAPKKICDIIERVMQDNKILETMISKLAGLSHRDAAGSLAKEVLALC